MGKIRNLNIYHDVYINGSFRIYSEENFVLYHVSKELSFLTENFTSFDIHGAWGSK